MLDGGIDLLVWSSGQEMPRDRPEMPRDHRDGLPADDANLAALVALVHDRAEGRFPAPRVRVFTSADPEARWLLSRLAPNRREAPTLRIAREGHTRDGVGLGGAPDVSQLSISEPRRQPSAREVEAVEGERRRLLERFGHTEEPTAREWGVACGRLIL